MQVRKQQVELDMVKESLGLEKKKKKKVSKALAESSNFGKNKTKL